jgi:hypothetical protein
MTSRYLSSPYSESYIGVVTADVAALGVGTIYSEIISFRAIGVGTPSFIFQPCAQ